MPLFGKKQSENGRKKMEHKLYLAKESRDENFDLSGCELVKIPSGVFPLCKVMNKGSLLLNNNFLSHISNGIKFSDLENLLVLDLQNNELVELPEDIKHMKSLRTLNVENNKLTKMPNGLSNLQSLRLLNIKNNKLKEFPPQLLSLQRIEEFHISENKMTMLPRDLCRLRHLRKLCLTADQFTFPPAYICLEGVEDIMKFLCEEVGIPYEPPLIESPIQSTSHAVNQALSKSTLTHNGSCSKLMQYDQLKDEKRKRLMALERHNSDILRKQTELATKANQNKICALDKTLQEEHRLFNELTNLQQERDKERRRVATNVYDLQVSANQLVKSIIDMNEGARKREEILEKMEKERIQTELWFVVRKEESECLRRAEILGNMRSILCSEDEAMVNLLQQHEKNREEAKQKAQAHLEENNSCLKTVVLNKKSEQSDHFQKLVKEEALQKEAFKQLQLQKDGRTQRITQQISIVEKELRHLTQAEMKRRQEKKEDETAILANRRTQLLDIFGQLTQEKKCREDQLKQRMVEMEAQRDQSQIDYWLIQFQRLLDRKPQALIDSEHHLEKVVLEILREAKADAYIPQFQRHRITIETLLQMSENDFIQIGVHIYGTRQSLIAAVKKYKKTLEIEFDDLFSNANAPEITEKSDDDSNKKENSEETKAVPSAPEKPFDTVALYEEFCCVCMEKDSVVLFLNCGHVCCCWRCSQSVPSCPLCRSNIVQRVRLQT